MLTATDEKYEVCLRFMQSTILTAMVDPLLSAVEVKHFIGTMHVYRVERMTDSSPFYAISTFRRVTSCIVCNGMMIRSWAKVEEDFYKAFYTRHTFRFDTLESVLEIFRTEHMRQYFQQIAGGLTLLMTLLICRDISQGFCHFRSGRTRFEVPPSETNWIFPSNCY